MLCPNLAEIDRIALSNSIFDVPKLVCIPASIPVCLQKPPFCHPCAHSSLCPGQSFHISSHIAFYTPLIPWTLPNSFPLLWVNDLFMFWFAFFRTQNMFCLFYNFQNVLDSVLFVQSYKTYWFSVFFWLSFILVNFFPRAQPHVFNLVQFIQTTAHSHLM